LELFSIISKSFYLTNLNTYMDIIVFISNNNLIDSILQ